MRRLEGQVALVTGGGGSIGRATALALGARGVRVVVAGRTEKSLGETVGEIAYGGGKARHVVADVRDPASVSAAIERALEAFGGLDLVVAAARAGEMGVQCTLKTAGARMAGPGRLVVVGARDAAVAELVRSAAGGLLAKRITCNAVVPGSLPGPWGAPAEPEAVAELVVFLCGSAAGAITGQTVEIGG